MSVVHVLGWVVLLVVVSAVLMTVALVARGRPPQPPRSARDRTTFTPRSMRGFDRKMRRDVRRRGSGRPRG